MDPLTESPAPAPLRRAPAPGLPLALMAAAIGLAFADASIVVLALPEIYGTFDVSIVDVSWVITTYNVAVVATVAVLVWVRTPARRLTALGLVAFAGASLACGAATSFGVLVGARAAQGAGAAGLLVGSLPLLASLIGSARRALSAWDYAAAVGVAVGPALGGALTQLLSWRSIFLVQAPVAALAVAVAIRDRPSPPPSSREAAVDPRGLDGRAAVADLALVLLYAALVGALFLAVLLFVVVWDDSPLRGALVVSVLAVGTVAIGPIGRALPPWAAALAGGWALTGGLVALAWLPAASAGYGAAALGFCGCGFGLLNALLGRCSFGGGPSAALDDASGQERLRRPGTLVVGAKHLGFVVGLVAIAPVLAGEIDAATDRATLAATAVVLDAPLELQVKVPLAIDLKDAVDETPRGEVPDVREPFDRRGADEDEEVAKVRDDLTDVVESTLTRSFRSSFLLAALFAAAAAFVAIVAGSPRKHAGRASGPNASRGGRVPRLGRSAGRR